MSRNNKAGVHKTAKLLGVKTVFVIESKAFHLDTVFTVLINKDGKLAGVIVCTKCIQNAKQLNDFLKHYGVPLIDIDPVDTIGRENNLGRQTVNCLAVPGVLIGSEHFLTKGVEEKISSLGIKHVISPTTQFKLSGAGAHCLTNEL